jgi:hypothetical protein
MKDSKVPQALEMTDEQIRANPTLDYTTPDLVSAARACHSPEETRR